MSVYGETWHGFGSEVGLAAPAPLGDPPRDLSCVIPSPPHSPGGSYNPPHNQKETL